jgi:hypothetical protein
MARSTANYYESKLRLINRGFLVEAEELDNMESAPRRTGSGDSDGDSDTSEDEQDKGETVIARRRAYVKAIFDQARKTDRLRSTQGSQKSMSQSDARREILKEFAKQITKYTTCSNCKG